MNYYNESGHIGYYKGHQVWIIDYNNFYKGDTIDSDDIWAVKTGPNQTIKLVLKGYEFGQMSHSGEVSLYRKEKPFVFYNIKPKSPEPKIKKETPKVEEKPIEVDLGVHKIDYTDYSQPVNTFFKELKDWWKDLNV